VPRRLARSFLRGDFAIRIDADFPGVLAGCADRPETWINGQIRGLYQELHRTGHAHSVEIWQGDALVGGLYGVALGSAFFGESMFSRLRDASKFALIALVARLNFGGFLLLDTQFVTRHLAALGAVEVGRVAYHRMLRAAVVRPARFLALPADADRQLLLQLSTHTS
jgi:leucyl/phenylalanyl-tRNA---protein transferase